MNARFDRKKVLSLLSVGVLAFAPELSVADPARSSVPVEDPVERCAALAGREIAATEGIPWTPVKIGLCPPASLPWCACDVYGIDFGLLTSSSPRTVGVLVSGWCNQAKDVAVGLQASGLFSQAGKMFGVQYGTFVVRAETLAGVSIGGCGNMTSSLYGCQLGLFNYCTSGYGVQIGLMNSALHGGIWQIGLINYNKEGPCAVLPLANFNW